MAIRIERLADRRLKNIGVVSPGTLVEFGAKSLAHPQFGLLDIPIFASLDEALTHVQRQCSRK
jgi:hypothetical protein